MRPIYEDLVDRRAGDEAALGAAVALSSLDVVGVEEERVARIRRHIRRFEGREDERLEEPARVGEVPLRGADVRHRADDVVFRLEGSTKCFGLSADGVVARREAGCGVAGGTHRAARASRLVYVGDRHSGILVIHTPRALHYCSPRLHLATPGPP
jgi:hypothetical protein